MQMKRALVAAGLLVSSVAYADDTETAVLIMGGINAGAARVDGETGFLFGAEVSVPVLRTPGQWFGDKKRFFCCARGWPMWAGIYGDYTKDFDREITMTTLGPELGFGPFGVDGGIAIVDGNVGFAVRPVLTIGAVSLYARYGQIEGESFTQFGALLKWGRAIVVR